MLHALKPAALQVVRLAGGFRMVARSRWRRDRLLILCYHGFALRDEHLWDPFLFVSGDHFARRLDRLRRMGCAVLPLGEALDLLHRGALPPRAVSLTVDDGNYDFLAVGMPVLARHGMHATVYVSTFHVLDQRPVFNVMASYLLWRAGQNGRHAVAASTDSPALAVGTREEVFASAAALRDHAAQQQWSADDKHACLLRLAEAAGEDWPTLAASRILTLMRPDELRALDARHADVQLHTHRHRTPRDPALFRREIEDNRAALAGAGLAPGGRVHFCYPSGVHHPEFLGWLREAGVRSATTCVPGLARADTDPLLLPRFIDTGVTPEVEFEAWCAGVRGLLRRPHRQFTHD